MKRQFILGLSMVTILSVLGSSLVNAQGTNLLPADSKAELNARVEARRTKMQTRLNNEEAARISGRCVGAQQKFGGIGNRFGENDTPLRAKYDAYIARLEKVIQKAEARSIDTSELKKNTDTFKQEYQAMISSVNEFSVSVSDLQSIDCRANPTAFKATLDSARTALTEVQSARKELAELAKGPLQESIKAIKTSVEKRD